MAADSPSVPAALVRAVLADAYAGDLTVLVAHPGLTALAGALTAAVWRRNPGLL